MIEEIPLVHREHANCSSVVTSNLKSVEKYTDVQTHIHKSTLLIKNVSVHS